MRTATLTKVVATNSTVGVFGSDVGSSYWRLCMAFCFACCLALMAYQPMWAATFEVDTELDGVDSNLADGLCLNVTVVAGGACTLRVAIQQANNDPLTADTINLPPGTYILTIENFLDNAEDESATGDLDITSNIVIEGAGAKVTIIEASDDLHDRVLQLHEDAVVALNRLTIRNGNTTELNGNSDGGGISVNGGKLDGFELVVSDNTALNNGGGIMTVGVNAMVLHRCTINGNATADSDGDGGGLYLGQNYGMTLANCTISGNQAGSRGGGIDISNNSNLAIILNTTIANNRVFSDTEQGGGVYMGNNTEVEVLSSIIANNFAEGDVANDCYGQFDLLDFSLVEALAPNDDCILAGDGVNNSSFLGSADPLLGPLADNGGDLQTHALLEGSLAIDAGSQLLPGSGGTACYATDARGQSRPGRAYCDMGSYEVPSALYMPKVEK